MLKDGGFMGTLNFIGNLKLLLKRKFIKKKKKNNLTLKIAMSGNTCVSHATILNDEVFNIKDKYSVV